jgi:hypothetical protein
MGTIRYYNTTASVRFPAAVSLNLEVSVGYVVDTCVRYKPKVDRIVSVQFKINGVFQGVEELALCLRDSGVVAEWLEEIQNQETEDAEYGENGRQSALGVDLMRG